MYSPGRHPLFTIQRFSLLPHVGLLVPFIAFDVVYYTSQVVRVVKPTRLLQHFFGVGQA